MKKFVRIRTKNHTAKPLRKSILVDDWAVVRLGSRTPSEHIFRTPRPFVEVNTIEAIENSRDKLRMKECFSRLKVPQADYWTFRTSFDSNKFPYPVIVKRINGFQGRGMELIHNEPEFDRWYHKINDHSNWFIEKFYNYAREYRLHVGNGVGVFLSWRKLRTSETTDRWFFNSYNCNWVGENHNLFDKPKCWEDMCVSAMNALKATSLDIGAVDIRVQSNKENNPKFIVCEINSAPALGTEGIVLYREVIKQIINNKKNG